jgi:hypothetical protein
MAQANACGTRNFWIGMTAGAAILFLVGIIMIVTIEGGCCEWDQELQDNGVYSCKNAWDGGCSGEKSDPSSCSDSSECTTSSSNNDEADAANTAAKDAGKKHGCCDEQEYCTKPCGKSNGDRAGKFLIGLALLFMGLILGASFSCGICPVCCCAKTNQVDSAPAAIQAVPMQAVLAQAVPMQAVPVQAVPAPVSEPVQK